MNEYTMCGGCGASHPNQRCLGCLHYFGAGSWDTREIYELDDEAAQAAAELGFELRPVQRPVRTA